MVVGDQSKTRTVNQARRQAPAQRRYPEGSESRREGRRYRQKEVNERQALGFRLLAVGQEVRVSRCGRYPLLAEGYDDEGRR